MRQEETTTLREKLEEKSKAGTGHSVYNPHWAEFSDSVFTVKVHLLYGQTICMGIEYAHAWFTTFSFDLYTIHAGKFYVVFSLSRNYTKCKFPLLVNNHLCKTVEK